MLVSLWIKGLAQTPRWRGFGTIPAIAVYDGRLFGARRHLSHESPLEKNGAP